MDIHKPTCFIDEVKVRRNIRKMVDKARLSGAQLRPHFKTHQSADIGQWYREEGVDRITVSSVDMATYFADAGWSDITIAFPYNWLESQQINELAGQINLNVLIESKASLGHLEQHVTNPLGYFVKIDVGYGRTGVAADAHDAMEELIEESSDRVGFRGFLAHAGHTYKARSKKQILTIHEGSVSRLLSLRDRFGEGTFLSYGDTPSCSVVDRFESINELRPGNFAIYDVMQHQIGSCELEEIAMVVACPVVAKHPDRGEVVIYGGGVHFSKDRIETDEGTSFGQVVRIRDKGTEIVHGTRLARVSQEHGIITGEDDFIRDIQVGEVVGVLPIHSCLAADLMPGYFTFDGRRLHKLIKSV